MGKGRDKRKKSARNDAEHAEKKRERQLAKQKKHDKRTAKKDSKTTEHSLAEEHPEAAPSMIVETLSDSDTSDSDLSLDMTDMQISEGPTESSNTPTARAAATLTPHPYLEKTDMLLFGGEVWNGKITRTFDSLFRYNTLTNSWREIISPSTSQRDANDRPVAGTMHCSTQPPPARSGHAAVCLPQLGALILFGGEYVSPNQKLFQHFSDTWRLHIDKQSIHKSLQLEAEEKSTTCYSWERLDCGRNAKAKPNARSGHRMAPWNTKVVLFGGFYDVDSGPSVKYFNDLWVLENLEADCEPQWRVIDAGSDGSRHVFNRPAARSGHCMAVQNDTVFIFGGYSVYYPSAPQSAEKGSSKTVTVGVPILHNDLWKYDLQSGVWSAVKTGLGVPPSPRSGITMASHPTKAKSYLFGGVKDEPNPSGSKRASPSHFFNDFFTFDHKTQHFFPVHMKREAPLSVAEEFQQTSQATTAASFPNWYYTEARKGVTSRGVIPCERFNAMLCVLGNNKLYLWGGQRELGEREVSFSDMFAIDLNTKSQFELLIDMDLSKQAWYGKDNDDATDSEWATTAADETTIASSGSSEHLEGEEPVATHSPAPVKMCQKEFVVGQPDASSKLTLNALSEHNAAYEDTTRRRRVTFQL